MSGWRHAIETSYGCAVNREGEGSWWSTPCDCASPTPDPASPCFQCGVPEPSIMHGDTRMVEFHRYVPTRCTCGHAIEEATR